MGFFSEFAGLHWQFLTVGIHLYDFCILEFGAVGVSYDDIIQLADVFKEFETQMDLPAFVQDAFYIEAPGFSSENSCAIPAVFDDLVPHDKFGIE